MGRNARIIDADNRLTALILLKEYKTIILEESNSVGILKLNRPKKLNAFNMQMLEDMLDAIDFVNKNSTYNVPQIIYKKYHAEMKYYDWLNKII